MHRVPEEARSRVDQVVGPTWEVERPLCDMYGWNTVRSGDGVSPRPDLFGSGEAEYATREAATSDPPPPPPPYITPSLTSVKPGEGLRMTSGNARGNGH
jgi:hypothetical protein